MLVEFKVCPTDVTHFGKDVARVIAILEEEELAYRLGPMGTAVEGDWDTVMAAIKRCHESLMAQHGRVITTITIDDRKDRPHHLDDMVSSVERRLRHPVRAEREHRPETVLEF
jgi:uncharacterized protein (TIGR00106 family)